MNTEEWAKGRARYAQVKTVTAKPGLPTNKHALEIAPGVYRDDAKEFCVSATCPHTYRWECDQSNEYGVTCNDPACKTFCT